MKRALLGIALACVLGLLYLSAASLRREERELRVRVDTAPRAPYIPPCPAVGACVCPSAPPCARRTRPPASDRWIEHAAQEWRLCETDRHNGFVELEASRLSYVAQWCEAVAKLGSGEPTPFECRQGTP